MSTILDETSGRLNIAPLSVEQYEAMILKGVLPEGAPIELIDGILVYKDRAAIGGDPMTVGTGHQLAMNKLARLLPSFAKHGCYLSIQAPIRIPPSHEPEPDAAVIRGEPEDYSRVHPGPREVCAVIEVSESSLLRDRTTKLRLYAEAGIRQYILVNVPEKQVEVYYSPKKGRYTGETIRAGRQSVAISTATIRYVTVKASDLLP